MVREGGQEPGEETEEDRAAGRVGEGHYHPKYQHQMHHYTEVRRVSVAAAARGRGGFVVVVDGASECSIPPRLC